MSALLIVSVAQERVLVIWLVLGKCISIVIGLCRSIAGH